MNPTGRRWQEVLQMRGGRSVPMASTILEGRPERRAVALFPAGEERA